MVPSIFVAVDALPLTAHGKIDRAALIERHALPRHAAAGAPPREGVETRIAAIWADALNLAAIGRDDDFFAIGGDSLNAAVVAAQVHDAFGVDIEMAAFSAHPTLAAFAAGVVERMARGLGGSEPPLRRIARDGVLPLSFTQQRLWAYSQDPSAFAGYRHVRRDRLTGPLDRAALRAAIETVVHRHEILRTSYPAVDGEPRAVIAPAAPVDLPFLDAAAADDPQQRAEAFAEAIAGEIADLSCRPLVRFAVVRIAEDEHILYRFNHHILGDGESWRIVLDDLEAAYACIRGGAAPPARDDDAPEYIDYASWQRTNLHPDGQAVQAALAWWRDALRDSWPAFAPGFRRPAALPGLDPSVGSASAALDAEAWTRLVALARANGATPFVAGLAATAAALAAESACDRIVVGTYVSMRNRLALERMLGDFTAPATILLSIPPAITVRDWIRRVNAQAAACVTHAAVPRDLIRKELGPLPDIALTFNLRGERSDRPFETLGLRRLPNRAAAMPWGLAIAAATAGNAMNLNARFDAGLYDPAGVAATLARLAAFIALASRLPDAPLGDLLARTKPARGPIGRLRRYATRLMSFGGSMSFGKGQT